MNINDLCTIEEHEKGFSAHYTNYGIVILKNNEYFMEVENETELHEILREEV